MTRLFLTRIPFFREVIVSSFACDECGYKNSELQPAGQIQEKGVRYTLNALNQEVRIDSKEHILYLFLMYSIKFTEGCTLLRA